MPSTWRGRGEDMGGTSRGQRRANSPANGCPDGRCSEQAGTGVVGKPTPSPEGYIPGQTSDRTVGRPGLAEEAPGQACARAGMLDGAVRAGHDQRLVPIREADHVGRFAVFATNLEDLA